MKLSNKNKRLVHKRKFNFSTVIFRHHYNVDIAKAKDSV